jgi:hypothetical protein
LAERRGARIVRGISATAPRLALAAARTRASSAIDRFANLAGARCAAAVRLASRGLLFLALAIWALTGFSAAAQAQVIGTVTVSPTTFTAAGQTLTFSIPFSTTRVLKSLSFTANSDDSPDDTVVCPSVATTFPIPQPNSFTCTATHVTTAADVTATFAEETPSFMAVDMNNTPVSGAGC